MRDKDYKVEVDGKLVTLAELKNAYRFWREYHLNAGDKECPICGSDLWERGLFVCEDCGKLKYAEDESPYEEWVCKDCDELYQQDKNFDEAVDAEIDRRRGK